MDREIFSYEKALEISTSYFNGDELAAKVFLDKYALRDNAQNLLESTPEHMHRRVASEIARIEKKKFNKPMSEDEIFGYLDRFKKIVPQGSLLYGIGNPYQYVSLSNCFVIDPPLDSYGSILKQDEELVQISKRRGGGGTDISNLRPDGTATTNAAKTSTGIIPFMERYSNSIREVGQSGRRGALLLSADIRHPEILKFVKVKKDLQKVTGANLSVKLMDDFMDRATGKDGEYELKWPVDSETPKVRRIVDAKNIWRQIIENAHATGEPGLLFWDTIIRESPADCYAEFGFTTRSTNPCGEIPLCPNDSCRLLLINAYSYVVNPFTKEAKFDYDSFYADCQIAQRFMDNIIDLELECIDRILKKIKSDPEPEDVREREISLWEKIKKMCKNGRRTGTGLTALADTLAAIGIAYASKESIPVVDKIYQTLKLGCYKGSVEMAKELGAFPVWNYELEKDNPFLNRIKDEEADLYKDMKKFGRRNIGILTSSPAGSMSILTQTSSAIEPVFSLSYERRKKINPNDKDSRVDFVDKSGDSWQKFTVFHPKVKTWMDITGETDISKSPWAGSCAEEISWKNRIEIQSKAQKHIDHSISSTLNLPEETTVDTIAEIYETAWKKGLKGVTVYRKNSRDGVLVDNSCSERKEEKIQKHDAPKRPKILPCDVNHISVKGEGYLVLVGILSDEPYEVFALKNGQIPKSVRNGQITKVSRGGYKFTSGEEYEIANIVEVGGQLEEAITRLVSMGLRHGADIEFIVNQLEKTNTADFGSFEKAIGRTLKKYIKDGTKVSGENCTQCGNEVIRENGCIVCKSCGWSKCG